MPAITFRARFVVLDAQTSERVYEAQTLAQAKGFLDAYSGGAFIFSAVEMDAAEFAHQICIVDEPTGQIVAHGPIVDLFDAAEAMVNLRLMVLPVSRKPIQLPAGDVA